MSQSSTQSESSHSASTASGSHTPNAVSDTLPSPTSIGNNDTAPSDQLEQTLWPISQTVLGSYVAVSIATFYTMYWDGFSSSYHNVLPFMGLNSDAGAPASILASSAPQSWLTDGAHVLSLLLPAFASGSVYLDTNYDCPNPTDDPVNPCPPRVAVNTWAIRVAEALVVTTAVVAVAAGAHVWHKPSGISGEPTSIAATASIMGHPDVVQDFHGIPVMVTASGLKKALKGKRYRLDTYQAPDGTERYGLVPVRRAYTGEENPNADLSDGEEENERSSALRPGSVSSGALSISDIQKRGRTWKDIAMYIDIVFGIYLLALLTIISSYLHAAERSVFAAAFQGSSFGARFALALFATIAATMYSRLQRGKNRDLRTTREKFGLLTLVPDVQTLSPYWELQKQGARADSTILLPKHSFPIFSLVPLLRRQKYIAAAVVVTALLSQFLIIALSGLPLRAGQLPGEFYFSGIASVTLLGIMIAMLVVVNIWRRMLPSLPRHPHSLAAVMMHVAGSKMCDDFQGMHSLSTKARNSRIRGLGKRYFYGYYGQDKDGRWVVDELPSSLEYRREAC